MSCGAQQWRLQVWASREPNRGMPTPQHPHSVASPRCRCPQCKACGFVSEVDARLRLNTYIVKNPPENKLSKAEKK